MRFIFIFIVFYHADFDCVVYVHLALWKKTHSTEMKIDLGRFIERSAKLLSCHVCALPFHDVICSFLFHIFIVYLFEIEENGNNYGIFQYIPCVDIVYTAIVSFLLFCGNFHFQLNILFIGFLNESIKSESLKSFLS